MSTAKPSASAPAPSARTRRLLHGIAGGLAGRVVNLLAPFIVMPAMLHYLGDADFGVWMTAVALTSMALFADLGIGNGLLTRLSAAFGRDERQSIRSDVSSAYAVLALVACGLALLGGLIWLGVGSGLAGDMVTIDRQAMAIAAACIGAFILGIPANVIQRVMYASERVLQANLWQMAGAAVAVGAALGAIRLDASPPLVVLCYALANPLVLMVSALAFFHRHRDIAPRLRDVDWPAARDLVHLGSRFLLLSVLTSIAMNADNLIIAARAGDEAVTAYAVPAKIGSLLGLVITALYLPMWGANGQALAQGELGWVRTQTWRMALLGTSAVAAAGIVLALSGNVIIGLWMGRHFADQRTILLSLGMLSTAMALASPFQMLLNAAGQIRVQIYAWSLFALLTIPAKYLFASMTDLYTIPLISFAGYALSILPMSYFFCRKIWS